LEAPASIIVDEIISQGFNKMRDTAEMIQKVSGTIYNWADEVINSINKEKILKEMTKVFRMSIQIINNVQH
jgi:hypothetical protein